MGRLIALKDIKKVCCKVPATSANLGSGFDIFGLSLPLYNKYVAYINPELKKPTIIVRGLGKGIIETNEVNLVYQSIKTAAKYLKLKINLKQIVLDLSYAIPLCGGLGSSSTAVVGGIILACKLGNKQITKDQLFNLASKLEGHPDNVAPCIYGGICSCFKDAKNTFQYLPLNYKKNLKIVINCPINFQLKTAKARAILPQSYSRADLVHSIERVTLFINALNNHHHHWLKESVIDKIHQPYRAKLIPGFNEIVKASYQHGSYAAFLSGSGATTAAFCDNKDSKNICQAVKKIYQKHHLNVKQYVFSINAKGVIY